MMLSMQEKKMSRTRNALLEQQFIVDNIQLSDDELVKAYEDKFNKPITLAAIRKRRQRLGIKKEGYAGKFSLVGIPGSKV